MGARNELFEYIFDILEDLGLVSWTKMYNRNFILEAFSQVNVTPYVYCKKDRSQFSASLRRVFNKHKKFTKYKGISESWEVFILRLIGYKKCSKCNETLTFENFSSNKNHISNLNNECKKCNKEYKEENKEIILQEYLVNKIYIVKEFGGCCSKCGYKENYAALELHHKDTNIARPKYSIDKYGSNRSPSNYLTSVSFYTMKIRIENERNNFILLCKNCHQKIDNKDGMDSQTGLKEALLELGHDYTCSTKGCEEEINLHLHHNNAAEKFITFREFKYKNKERILLEGLLETEMKKDVSILCGNHHREIHNPRMKL